MADGMTTMFGKAYDTVGSADKNLILQTRGDLKVKWGGKFIDLIKNGKINVDIDFLKQVDSKEAIYKDGVYLILQEDKQEVWLSVGGTLVNLLGEVGENYVSFLALQETKAENKIIALKNTGFFYDTLEDAKKAQLQQGLVYILGELLLYKIKEGNYSKYNSELAISDPLILGSLTITGATSNISGASELYLSVGNDSYMSFSNNKIIMDKEVVTHSDLLSNDYLVKLKGYRLYIDSDGISTLEIDKVIIRRILEYDDTTDVTYLELKKLIEEKKLIPKKKYKIIDFQNEWEITARPIYKDVKYATPKNGIEGEGKDVWPIIVLAINEYTLYDKCIFEDNEDWYAEYDPSFYYFVREETVDNTTINLFSKGRITLLRDEHGNQCNYDFKHKLFKYTSNVDNINQWYYTFNVANINYDSNYATSYTYESKHMNADATLLRNTGIINNVFNIPEPKLEDIEIVELGETIQTKKILDSEEYLIFPDCTVFIPHDNTIEKVTGAYAITQEFYGNYIKGLLLNVETTLLVEFNFNFYNNTFNNIYIKGNELEDIELVVTFSNSILFHDNVGLNVIGTEFTKNTYNNTFQNINGCLLDAQMVNNTFDKDLLDVNIKCNQMENNHITGTIYTENDASSYPIEVGTFSDNTIHDIRKTKITCSNNNITNNTIHDIAGYVISNTSITNNEIQDLIGDDTGQIPDIDPGGGGGSNPSGTGMLVVEPTATSISNSMHGIYVTPNMYPNTAGTNIKIGYIDPVSDNYGTPTVYGIYVSEYGNMLDFSNIRFARKSDNSFDIMANITANELNTYKKVHVWIQFSLVSELGYINVHQAAGSSSSTGDYTGDANLSTAPDEVNKSGNFTASGTYNNAGGGLSADNSTNETLGTITLINTSLGAPTIYGIYNASDSPSSMLKLSDLYIDPLGNNTYLIKARNVLTNNTTSIRHVKVGFEWSSSIQGYVNVFQKAGPGNSSGGGSTPSGDADVDEYLNTFKSSSLSSTTLSDSKYALLSTAMDKLDSFESNIMSDSMFVDDALILPSGNSAETRNARRGWFMALLLTALYPMKGSTTVNNDILKDAMLTWGIGTWNSNKSTAVAAIGSYSVSTYEAKYKGLLQGSIAFSYLFSDSSFVNSFSPFTSYSYQSSDGDLGASSSMGYYHSPQGQYFFPYPPTNNINATSGLMKRDEDAFIAGKNLRDSNSSRAILAAANEDLNGNPIGDVNTSLKYYIRILNAATGKTYSETPGKGSLLYDTQWNGNRTVNLIKNADNHIFWRDRPAWVNNDTSVDSDTYNLNFGTTSGKTGDNSHSTSYPSGHTGYLWHTAFCFMTIGGLSNSAIVNLFKRAYQYSESRVIAGAHWQMCVEMGRIAAACSFATLCGNTKFILELLAALS